MLYYLSAAGLIAHTFFWGLGLAWLVVPRAWRRWGWMFAPACGWALQSAVVWAGAHTALAGTAAYAWASELLPLALLIAALGRGRARRMHGGLGVAGIAVVAGWLLLSPMAAPGRGLTASSLGSCDQADYAAGARVFQYRQTAEKHLAMPIADLNPISELLTQVRAWEAQRPQP